MGLKNQRKRLKNWMHKRKIYWLLLKRLKKKHSRFKMIIRRPKRSVFYFLLLPFIKLTIWVNFFIKFFCFVLCCSLLNNTRIHLEKQNLIMKTWKRLLMSWGHLRYFNYLPSLLLHHYPFVEINKYNSFKPIKELYFWKISRWIFQSIMFLLEIIFK